MANGSPRSTKKVILILVFSVIESVFCAQIPVGEEFTSEFTSIEQKGTKENADYKEVLFGVHGRNIRADLQVKTTTTKSDRDSECMDLNFNYNISERQNSDAKWAEYVLTVPKNVQGIVYLCLQQRVKNNNAELNPQIFNSGYKWLHQGPGIKLDLSTSAEKVE